MLSVFVAHSMEVQQSNQQLPGQRPSSLQNYFSVSIPERNTEQECLLCAFPADLLGHFISVVKLLIKDELRGSVSDGANATQAENNPTRRVVKAKRTARATNGPALPVSTPYSRYLVMLDLKISLLSMMSSCYALHSKMRGKNCDWSCEYH